MIAWLTQPSKTFAESAEIGFEVSLIVSTLIVVVGLIGEYRKRVGGLVMCILQRCWFYMA